MHKKTTERTAAQSSPDPELIPHQQELVVEGRRRRALPPTDQTGTEDHRLAGSLRSST